MANIKHPQKSTERRPKVNKLSWKKNICNFITVAVVQLFLNFNFIKHFIADSQDSELSKEVAKAKNLRGGAFKTMRYSEIITNSMPNLGNSLRDKSPFYNKLNNLANRVKQFVKMFGTKENVKKIKRLRYFSSKFASYPN
jgi:hypothetical protein